MRLLLIRHGQSENNLAEHGSGYAQRRLPDPPLTPLGLQQARHTAAHLAAQAHGVTHLYTSLMTRAVQTAAPFAQILGLPAHGLAAAYEYGGLTTGPAGHFAPVLGRDHAALQGDCPALVWPQELTGQPWDGGAEAWEEAVFERRAQGVLTGLRAAHGDSDSLALITHHDFAGALIRAALGWAGTGTPPIFRLAHLSTTLLEVPEGGRPSALHWLNRVDHLPAEWVRH
ncbi:histidine phosphatase family protein [Deinococcus multiflagellatus]|uniref:Histidine phosphatase family protein n=1 Tax=Deinococcus multiflagellatus TaxID=1656887 RepID=A0ABW1ZHH0_9DEIO|nr:histidine phosphatase family protein [Deinococcus multiflagellatus]MBZ9711700.1 phosphoglycerate mutase family protein [Deinococcus multiflagellatus]